MTDPKKMLGECPTDDELLMNFDIPGQKPDIQNHIENCSDCAKRSRELIADLLQRRMKVAGDYYSSISFGQINKDPQLPTALKLTRDRTTGK